jgi:hypothetical protein
MNLSHIPKFKILGRDTLCFGCSPLELGTWCFSFLCVTPGFKAKPNAHSMCDQKSSLHTYCSEMGTE